MGLDAYILAKFKEDAPEDIVDKFKTFHDDEIYGDGYNRWHDYKEMTYLINKKITNTKNAKKLIKELKNI